MAKSFKDNPCLNFVSTATESASVPDQTEPAKEIPANLHLLEENKTERMQLVMQPTLKRLVTEKAKATGTSTNNFIINIIIDALQE